MLENFVTATRPVVEEDRYGNLNQTSVTTITTFWADIQELDSDTTLEQGKKRIATRLRLTCREDDIENVGLDDVLIIDGYSEQYQVNDYFDSEWKFGSTIIAEIKI